MSRILVIDDAATVRMYHRKILGDAGWQTDEAINGLEALEKVNNQPADEPFDLFVVDINMPKMDGYSFVRELRRHASARQSPVMMVSTEAQSQDTSVAFDAGAATGGAGRSALRAMTSTCSGTQRKWSLT